MVVIFGWGEDAKDIGEVAPITCPNCHNDVFLHQVHSQKQVSLYFVPLVPYGTNEYLVCPVCRRGMQLQANQQAAVAEMRAATSVFRRGGVDEARYSVTVRGFWRALGVDPAATRPVEEARAVSPTVGGAATRPGGGTPGSTASSPPSLAVRLADLGRLHESGVLTDDEFSAAKRRLLGR